MRLHRKTLFGFAILLALSLSGLAAGPQSGPYSKDELLRPGPVRTFEGRALNEVAFPLGGIGTGTISLGGRGNLRDWEIFNRPGKGVHMPFSFFALYFEGAGKKLVRVLEGPIEPPFTTGFGFKRVFVPGLPRMEKARFKGEYPFAEVELSDSQVPLEIRLEAFNPFIPLEADDSGIPAFVLRYRVKNTGSAPAKITIAGSIINPVGYDGVGTVDGLGHDKFGQNVNEIRTTPTLRGLAMSSGKVKPGDAAFGTMALTTSWPDTTYLTHWVRGDWWDDLQIFWDDLAADGRLKDLAEASPSPDKQTDVGTLGLVATIGPGEEAVLPFIVSWNFPNVLNYFDVVPEQRGRIFKNHYATAFADAWAAAEYLQANLARLEKASRAFHDAFFATTLPPYVLDAVSSQASIIRTTTGFRLEGGNFFGFEGCGDQSGCCPLNCAHVWNYAQSLAFLFPALERTMRETDFLNNVKPDGAMMFRTSLPLGSGVLWDFKPAADGQMGRIISLYRDWQISGDTAWLKKLWPQAKKALDYAWKQWDADRDGLMEGEQHNTYDIEFFGPNSMMGAFYLGALKAGAAMAMAAGDVVSAKAYLAMYNKGRAAYDATLWNGEFYVQKYDKVMETKYQYGEGCLSDMLLGQWLGMVAGLDRYLPADRIKSSLQADLQAQFPDRLPELLQRPADLRPQRREGPAPVLVAEGRPAAPALPVLGRGLDGHRVPGRLAPHLRRAPRGGPGRRQGRPRPLRRPPPQSLERGRMRPSLCPGHVVMGRPAGPLGPDVFGPRDEDRLRAEDEHGRLPDGLDGRFGLGDLLSKGGGGERAGRHSRSRERRSRPQRDRPGPPAGGRRKDGPFGQDPPCGFLGRGLGPQRGRHHPGHLDQACPRRTRQAAGPGHRVLKPRMEEIMLTRPTFLSLSLLPALIALVLAAACAPKAPSAPGPKGHLFIIGGGERDAPLMKRYIRLAEAHDWRSRAGVEQAGC